MFGYSLADFILFAPRINEAFSFSPYRNGSFPFTIPHCISKHADPDTNGTAIDVPDAKE